MAGNMKLPDINLVVISGRLTRDVEVRYTPGGRAVAKARIANSRRYRNATTNEWQEEATFVDVTIWGEAAERTKDRMRKGAPVLVEGRLQSESWEAKDGTKRASIKITARRVQLLETAAGAQAAPGTQAAAQDTDGQATSENAAVSDMEEVAL